METIYPALIQAIKNGQDPAKGSYVFKELVNKHFATEIWAFRTSPVKKYVDDVKFTINWDDEGIKV